MQSEKTKVVIVINDFLVGGAQKLIADQLQLYDEDSFDYVLVTLFEFSGRENFYNLIPPDISVYRLNFSGFKDIKSWFNLFKTLKEIRPDVAVSHLFFSNTVARVLGAFLGYFCIAVEHNTYVHKTRFQIFVDWVLSHFTFKIVAVSETVARFTSKQERIPLRKFEIIYDGVNVGEINSRISELPDKDAVKESLGFSKKYKLIINVARLTPQKNHLLLIESFSRFVKNYPEYKLVILGEGGLRKKLKKRIDVLNMEEKIFMPGHKNPFPYYKASEYFILTSDIEGFAIVGIEAMACGLPVLSTKTAGPDEYIQEGKNGFFIGESSVDSVVEGMKKFVDADLDFFRKYALETAKEFDVKTTEEKYAKLIKNAVRY